MHCSRIDKIAHRHADRQHRHQIEVHSQSITAEEAQTTNRKPEQQVFRFFLPKGAFMNREQPLTNWRVYTSSREDESTRNDGVPRVVHSFEGKEHQLCRC